jgi:hypothetical protein
MITWTVWALSYKNATRERVLELNYNVMAHAKKTVFMYEQNRQDHIVLQQI